MVDFLILLGVSMILYATSIVIKSVSGLVLVIKIKT